MLPSIVVGTPQWANEIKSLSGGRYFITSKATVLIKIFRFVEVDCGRLLVVLRDNSTDSHMDRVAVHGGHWLKCNYN